MRRTQSRLGLALALSLLATSFGAAAHGRAVPAPKVVAAAAQAKQLAARAPKVITAEEAATKIGRGVFVATGSAMPPNVIPLMRQHALARDGRTNVFYMSTFAAASNFDAKVTDKWHPNLLFVSGNNRAAATKALAGGKEATLHRSTLFQLGQRIAKDELPIDTVVVRVSPPDKDGMVSLGTSADLTLSAIQSALRRGGTVIAEVNPNVPHARGNRIPYTALSYVFEGQDLLSEAVQINPMGPELAIAGHIARLVPNRRRATIQVGIGNALAGVGEALRTKTRLDIWSEMGPDGLVRLVAGDKSHVRRATFSFLHGTNDAYQIANDNPRLEMAPSTIVNDPGIIATKKRIRAINTALEVDFMGNVNAERDGDRVISSPGGQPDFMAGASTAPDGKAILALRSLAKGEMSTIVSKLKGPVTTPAHHVDHVVTEWGATRSLRGLAPGRRAYEIISVSHPVLRGDLAKAAREQGLLNGKQLDKLGRSVYPAILRGPMELRQGAADAALAKQAITAEQHAAILKTLPEVAAQAPVEAP